MWYLIVSIPDLCNLTYFKGCVYLPKHPDSSMQKCSPKFTFLTPQTNIVPFLHKNKCPTLRGTASYFHSLCVFSFVENHLGSENSEHSTKQFRPCYNGSYILTLCYTICSDISICLTLIHHQFHLMLCNILYIVSICTNSLWGVHLIKIAHLTRGQYVHGCHLFL